MGARFCWWEKQILIPIIIYEDGLYVHTLIFFAFNSFLGPLKESDVDPSLKMRFYLKVVQLSFLR